MHSMANIMKQVLIFQERLPSYRINFFTHLACLCNLRLVLDSKLSITGEGPHDVDLLSFVSIVRYSNIQFFLSNLRQIFGLIKVSDTVVIPSTFRLYTFLLCFLTVLCRKSLILWGIGHMPYENPLLKYLRVVLYLLSSKIILYSHYEAYMYSCLFPFLNHKLDYFLNSSGMLSARPENIERLAEIHNTPRKQFIYVGRLNRKSMIKDLCEDFLQFNSRHNNKHCLVVVGAGDLYLDCVRSYSSTRIIFTGAIYNPMELYAHYSKSYFSIYYGSAGLSVLTSFEFSTPIIIQKGFHNQAPEASICNTCNSICFSRFNGTSSLPNVLEAVTHLSFSDYSSMAQSSFLSSQAHRVDKASLHFYRLLRDA